MDRGGEKFIKCEKCGVNIYHNWENCPYCGHPTNPSSGRKEAIMWLIIVGVFSFLLTFFLLQLHYPWTQPKDTSSRQDFDFSMSKPIIVGNDTIELLPVKPPSTGIYQLFTTDTPQARLTFESNPMNGRMYFFKFTDANTGKVAFTVFVGANETCEVLVPLGSYMGSMVSGTEWYGEHELFGPKGYCYKADDSMNLYSDGQYIWGSRILLEAPEQNGCWGRALPSEF